MTNEQTPETPGLLRVALRAYPKASRGEHAQELAAIYAEATAAQGRIAAAREALDVAGHGLRLRCGLGGGGRADEIVARAVPLAVTLTATQGVAYVVALAVMLLDAPEFAHLGPADQLVLVADAGASVVWLAVLGLLLAGRTGAARILGTSGTLAQLPVVLAALPGLAMGRADAVGGALLPSLFVWLLLLAAPRDILATVEPRDRRLMGGVALFALLPYALMLLVHYRDVMMLYVSFVWFVPVGAALALARRHSTVPAALGVAAVVGVLRFGLPELAGLTSARTVAFSVLALAAVTLAWRLDVRNRRRNPDRTPVGS